MLYYYKKDKKRKLILKGTRGKLFVQDYDMPNEDGKTNIRYTGLLIDSKRQFYGIISFKDKDGYLNKLKGPF